MTIATTSPSTGEILKTFAPHSADDVERRVALAHETQLAWRATSLDRRVALIRRVGALLDDRRDRYGRLMTMEMGKLLGAARDEAGKCALACRYYAEHARSMLADEPVVTTDERGYVVFQPLGVVLAVMPWNFPFWQVLRFAAPAIVAGNTALLKHASNVPQCALEIEALFRDAGAPEGVFQTLLVGSEAVAGLVADPRIAAVSLTGSEGAGSSVGALAGKHLKKSVLELGGSDPFIVMPSADIEKAVGTAVRARMINNGQSCIAAKRFIVHEAVADDFESRLVKAFGALQVGDPLLPSTLVGPLASAQVAADLERQVQESVAGGAKVLVGGTRPKQPGFWYNPTIIANASPGSPAYDDEMFGPVATLLRARDADDAIRIANDTRFGLGAAVWTSDRAEADRFAHELETGTVFVNGMVSSDPRFPFGGIKASGYGRELSGYGLREFVNIKTIRMFEFSDPGRGSSTE